MAECAVGERILREFIFDDFQDEEDIQQSNRAELLLH
jgi:hypothetical protein